MISRLVERNKKQSFPSVQMEFPIMYRHFHQANGALRATVAWTGLTNGQVALGIARCNKKDRPSKVKGRQIATTRLTSLLNALISPSDYSDYLDLKNLTAVMPMEEFADLISENPFTKWGCKWGASPLDQNKLESLIISENKKSSK